MHSQASQCFVGHFRGVEKLSNEKIQGIRTNVSCNQWKCEKCRKKLIAKLRKRIFQGKMEEYITNGSRYSVKFLTLTLPGKEFRSEYTIEEAYNLMSECFTKLRKALAKSCGEFHYLRVVEEQRDGYPHYHVILAGDSIARKDINEKIRSLWIDTYKLGNIDLKIVKSIKHAVRYITKYMLKSEGVFKKKGKKYTASTGLLEPVKKREWLDKKFYLGTVRTDNLGKAHIEEKEIDPNSPFFEYDVQGFIMRIMQEDSTPF